MRSLYWVLLAILALTGPVGWIIGVALCLWGPGKVSRSAERTYDATDIAAEAQNTVSAPRDWTAMETYQWPLR